MGCHLDLLLQTRCDSHPRRLLASGDLGPICAHSSASAPSRSSPFSGSAELLEAARTVGQRHRAASVASEVGGTVTSPVACSSKPQCVSRRLCGRREVQKLVCGSWTVPGWVVRRVRWHVGPLSTAGIGRRERWFRLEQGVGDRRVTTGARVKRRVRTRGLSRREHQGGGPPAVLRLRRGVGHQNLDRAEGIQRGTPAFVRGISQDLGAGLAAR